jgi:signal transduction histidine kinase
MPSLLAILYLVALVVAFCAGLVHLQLYLLRRREPEHAWFAVAALGVAGLSLCTLGLYASESAYQASLWQALGFCAWLLVSLGFMRFTQHYLGERPPALGLAGFAFGALAVKLSLGTSWLFNGEGHERIVAPFGEGYVEPGLSLAGVGLCAVFGAIHVRMMWLYARAARSRSDAWPPLRRGLSVLCLVLLHDFAVISGTISLPYVIPFGYFGLIVALSNRMVRRFAHSLDEVERLAGTLHERVQERTAELRRRDLELAQGAKMAAIGTLAAGLAHEINNPIAFVSANLNHLEELWKERRDAGDADEALDVLTDCREGVERVRTIVSDLLYLARPSEGRSQLVDLAGVARSVLPLLRHEARNRARIETSLDRSSVVLGDPRLLGQVVLNLVLNAAQAIPEGDPEHNRIELALETTGDRVRLRVRDTGSGIAEEVLPFIFDPFFTTKEAGQGTGLGLAVSERIVREHGGRIRVQSGPGGTCMTLELPAPL